MCMCTKLERERGERERSGRETERVNISEEKTVIDELEGVTIPGAHTT